MKVKFEPVVERYNRVLIIGGGESLIDFDIEQIKDFKGAIITVNNIVYHLPRADYWITVDPMSNGEPQVAMREKRDNVKYFCAYPDLKKYPYDKGVYKAVEGVQYLERIVPDTDEYPDVRDYRLQEDKSKITTGDSCYGALGLAYHMEATEIIMLGIDAFGLGHWYNKQDPYNKGWGKGWKNYLASLPVIYRQSVEQFKERGVKVVMGSPRSHIDCFERMNPDRAYNYFD